MAYQDSKEAFALANTYNLNPRRNLPYVGTHNYDTGMFEADYFCASGTPPNFNVTGPTTPNINQNYYAEATYNGKSYYTRIDALFFLWWDGIDSWYISSVKGTPGTAYWKRTDPDTIGEYAPAGTATGTATVSMAKRYMILAHIIDKSNVLVRYNPDLNLVTPYHVTGTLTPDAAGNYAAESEYKNKFTYVNSGRTYFLWWDGIDSWIISDSVGWKEGAYWSRTDPAIIGEYAPQGGAIGTATVAAGPE
jgi:hypothetical protein